MAIGDTKSCVVSGAKHATDNDLFTVELHVVKLSAFFIIGQGKLAVVYETCLPSEFRRLLAISVASQLIMRANHNHSRSDVGLLTVCGVDTRCYIHVYGQ